MERKQALKYIRQLIGNEEYEKAELLIQDLLGNADEDYLLYVFAALVRFKRNDTGAALEFYKKAVALDESRSAAWQGLAKLLESGQLPEDEFMLDVVDRLILIYREVPEKRRSYVGIRDRVLLNLRKYDVILQENRIAENVELCELLLRTLVIPDRDYEHIERLLCERCVSVIENETPVDDDTAYRCVVFRASFTKSFIELRQLLLDGASKFDLTSHLWALNTLRSLISASLLHSRELDTSACDLLLSSPERSCFESLLELIRDCKFEAALDLVVNLNTEQISWPLSGLAVLVCLKQEQYERVLKLVDVALSEKRYIAIERIAYEGLLTAKAEALDGIGDESSIFMLHQLLNSDHFDSEIWNFLLLMKSADSNSSKEEFLLTLDNLHIIEEERYCWMALRAAKRGDLSEAKENAEKALDRIPGSWRLMVVLAEALILVDSSNPNATALLLKAAKLSGPNTRIYYRLGENLAKRSLSKALGCLDMAAKIRPQHLGVVQLRDKLLGLEGRKREQLANVERFLAIQPRCFWALKRLALLKLQLDMVDEAVEDLQVVLRLARDDTVLLCALGIAYGKRGNFESAIKTLKFVLELNPEDRNARMQLAQMYRIYGELDDAMEQCKLLRESGNAPKCLLMLHADLLLHMARRESSPSKCIALVNDLFALLNTTSHYSVASLKVIGDSLMFVATFGEQTFTRVVFPSKWPISSQADALRIAADAYFAITKLRPSAESWNDVGLAFLRRSRLCGGDTRMAKRAMMGFQQALSMDSCKETRSTLWTNIAEAVWLAGSPLSSLHCIKAALLLNANNAFAWSLLALLFFTVNKYESSQHAIDMAMKEDAKLAETWCLQALLKEREGSSSVADLFGQSISLKPTSLAIERFSFHTMRMLHNGVAVKGTNMFDFDAVNDAIQMGRVDDQLIFFVALLAEQMGCFTLASTYIDQCSVFPGNHIVHQQRINIQKQCGQIDGCVEPRLIEFANLYRLKIDQIYHKLLASSADYSQLFDAIDRRDTERMRSLLIRNDCDISSIVLISALISFKKTLTGEMINIIRHMCPQHPLVVLYPPDSTVDEDDEFAYDALIKGDIPSPCRDNYTQLLCELMLSRKEIAKAVK
uniref:Uncharacterized protein n=1 Tax=Parascaris univalens TaxID=6257 RepID=A0A915BBM0_PARUN